MPITAVYDREADALYVRLTDSTRVRAGAYDLPATLPRYTGFREVTVLFGDSLPSIAAREMSDARRWLDLALANGLKSPYISEEGVPGTLRPGQPILIPTTEPPTATDQVRSAGNPVEGTSQLEALFARGALVDIAELRSAAETGREAPAERVPGVGRESLSRLTEVLFDSARSAEPPTSSGSLGARAARTFPEAFRVDKEIWSRKSGRSCSQPRGRPPAITRSHSAASSGSAAAQRSRS